MVGLEKISGKKTNWKERKTKKNKQNNISGFKPFLLSNSRKQEGWQRPSPQEDRSCEQGHNSKGQECHQCEERRAWGRASENRQFGRGRSQSRAQSEGRCGTQTHLC